MINPYLLLLVTCLLAIHPEIVHAQASSLSLTEAHALAQKNYPMLKQHALIDQRTAYATEQANAAYLPQINIHGQATYQSAVTEIPIQVPGMDIPSLNKDQYKLYGEVNQNLYDGGMTRLQQQAIAASGRTAQQALEVELYAINDRVNQLYFGILLLNEQLLQNELLKKDIQAGLDKARAAIANGAALKSSASVLEAELLKTGQQATELRATRKAYLHRLSLFIGQPVDEQTVLEKPGSQPVNPTINRPELGWFSQQQSGIATEHELLNAKNRPKLGLFLQAGAGRPALNMLSNDFDAYYYGGVRLTIPISGFYILKKERALLDVQAASIAVQAETFLFNTDLALQQQNTEMAKYRELLATDNEIIALRAAVKEAALAQLENGVITTADYVREVNAEDRARLAKIGHQLQLLKAQYDIQYTTGN